MGKATNAQSLNSYCAVKEDTVPQHDLTLLLQARWSNVAVSAQPWGTFCFPLPDHRVHQFQ